MTMGLERAASHQAASTRCPRSSASSCASSAPCAPRCVSRSRSMCTGTSFSLSTTVAGPSVSGRAVRRMCVPRCVGSMPPGSSDQDTPPGASPAAEDAQADAALASMSQIVGCKPCMDGTMAQPIDESKVVTRFIAETLLPTRHGRFRLRGYKHSVDGGVTFTEPTAIIAGVVEGMEEVPVRVHDACYTSEVLGSLKCDCADQLALAMETVYQNPPGMIIYLQQEGRGIGLANKIAAYSLQEQGLDTVDANRALGLPDDCREYTSVRNIIRDLNIKSVKLMTNNPRKINQLTALGIEIVGRVPCLVKAGEFNQNYLETKMSRMDHMLEGQWCYWNHDGEPREPSVTEKPELGGMGVPGGLSVTTKGVVSVPSNLGPHASRDVSAN